MFSCYFLCENPAVFNQHPPFTNRWIFSSKGGAKFEGIKAPFAIMIFGFSAWIWIDVVLLALFIISVKTMNLA